MRVSPQLIFRHIRREYSVRQEELVGGKHFSEFVKPRHTAVLLLREDVGLSFGKIAKIFGWNNSTSARASYRAALVAMSEDDIFSALVVGIRFAMHAEINGHSEKMADRREKVRDAWLSLDDAPSYFAPVEIILGSVCRELRVSEKKLKGQSQKPSLVRARHIAFFLLWNDVKPPRKRSACAIGKVMKHHVTTVTHGCNAMALALRTDATVVADVARIRAGYGK